MDPGHRRRQQGLAPGHANGGEEVTPAKVVATYLEESGEATNGTKSGEDADNGLVRYQVAVAEDVEDDDNAARDEGRLEAQARVNRDQGCKAIDGEEGNEWPVETRRPRQVAGKDEGAEKDEAECAVEYVNAHGGRKDVDGDIGRAEEDHHGHPGEEGQPINGAEGRGRLGGGQ